MRHDSGGRRTRLHASADHDAVLPAGRSFAARPVRPFDESADGTLLGEGVGIVVLKRVEDAERDGDKSMR